MKKLDLSMLFLLLGVLLFAMNVSAQTFSKSDFLQKVETDVDLTSAYTHYKICNPSPDDYSISKSSDFGITFNVVRGNLKSYTFEKLEQVPYEVDDYTQYCTDEAILVKGNETNGTVDHYENITTCHQEKTGSHTEYRGEWKEFKPVGSTFKKGECYDVRVSGAYDAPTPGNPVAIDNIINYATYSFDEYDWWNKSAYDYTAFVNYSNLQGSISSGEGLFYLAKDNCTNNNFTSGTMNMTCFDNLCKRLLNGTDCSDIDFFDPTTNQTLNWTRVNMTGLANWSQYNNLTNNVSFDAVYVRGGINQSSNVSNVCIMLNGVATNVSNSDLNVDETSHYEFSSYIMSYSSYLIDISGQGLTASDDGMSFIQDSRCGKRSNYSSLGCVLGVNDKKITAPIGSFPSTTGWTICLDLNMTQNTTDATFYHSNAASNTYINLYWGLSGGVGYHWKGLIWKDGSNYLVPKSTYGSCDKTNTWYHICYTRASKDTNWVDIFCNGVNITNTNTILGTAGAITSQAMIIGNDPSLNYDWQGMVDSVIVYNRSLSSNEILDRYRHGAHLPTEYYNLSIVDNEFLAATETEGRAAIETGVYNALGSGYTIYTDQQVYLVSTDGQQQFGTFDKMVTYSNKRWAFNYDQNSSAGFMNLLNLTPIFYVLEMFNMTSTNITGTVETFINNAKN